MDYIRPILRNIHVVRSNHGPVILLLLLLRFSELGTSFSMDRMESSDCLVYIHQTRQVDRLTPPSPFRHRLCARLGHIWVLTRIY